MDPVAGSPSPEPKKNRKWWMYVLVFVAVVLGIIITLRMIASNMSKNDDFLEQTNVKTSLATTPTVTPTPSQKQTTSVITGSVGYPSSVAPAQIVCAVSTTSAAKTCIDYPGSVAAETLSYSIIINPGTYNVYASLKAPQGDFSTSYKAYYNKYVACSIVGNCASGLHGQNIAVVVGPGITVGGVDPTDWYSLGITQ